MAAGRESAAPMTCGFPIGEESKTRFAWSGWSETPDSAEAISATFTRRLGPWSITSAPRHPREFLTFLDLLRSPEIGGNRRFPAACPWRPSFPRFQRAFGSDLDALERDWRAFMATVKTPLEQNQPPDQKTPKPSGPPPRRKT